MLRTIQREAKRLASFAADTLNVARLETDGLTIRSPLGYTGSDQSRQEMLANSHFVDAKVEILAKYGATQWKKLGGNLGPTYVAQEIKAGGQRSRQRRDMKNRNHAGRRTGYVTPIVAAG